MAAQGRGGTWYGRAPVECLAGKCSDMMLISKGQTCKLAGDGPKRTWGQDTKGG